ncbi:PEGA domain protein [Enhygromyxa salina]|uniref:PEGA domain protein n=1 Tax=Enhygromyxa salina TaxID=215803 RepID=A0A2S9YGW9_9BACT|nr:PEGA domain-containing protein [Enhygromyxa salina]PRQ04363.1 PEGA domain protein [Enhygromyxa salina]
MAPMPSEYGCSSDRRPARAAGRSAVLLAFALALGCAHGPGARAAPTSLLEIASVTTDADVWVDGQYIGQVAAVSGQLRLAPGVHRVEVRKPGHFPVQRTVRVEKHGGGSVVVEAELLTDPR